VIALCALMVMIDGSTPGDGMVAPSLRGLACAARSIRTRFCPGPFGGLIAL